MVSGDFFTMLGVQPVIGRFLSPSDDYHGCGTQGAFSATPSGSGNTAAAPASSEQAHSRRPSLPGHRRRPAQLLWHRGRPQLRRRPRGLQQPLLTQGGPWMDEPHSWWLAAIGRLKPGWTIERASAQLAAISPGIFAATFPDEYDAVAKRFPVLPPRRASRRHRRLLIAQRLRRSALAAARALRTRPPHRLRQSRQSDAGARQPSASAKWRCASP